MEEGSMFIQGRYRALWEAYCKALEDYDTIDHSDAIRKAIAMPASRYWISPSEAYRQISGIIHGRKPKYKEGSGRWKMIWAVYEEYKKLREQRVFRGATVRFVVSFAIQNPAPSLYFSFNRARKVIDEIKKGKYGIINS